MPKYNAMFAIIDQKYINFKAVKLSLINVTVWFCGYVKLWLNVAISDQMKLKTHRWN